MAHATTQDPTSLSREIRRNATALAAAMRRARRGEAAGIHRVRVATRRLRQALKSLPDGGETAAELRRLGRSLGRVRELDMARTVLAASAKRESWPAQAVARVDAWCLAERQRAFDDARRVLDESDARAISKRLRALGSAAEAQPKAGSAAREVRDTARTLTAAIAAAGTLYVPTALHEVRIAAKKLRYGVELSGEIEAGTLRRLRELQTVLGSMHDLQVLQQCVQDVALDARGLPEMATLSSMARTIEEMCRRWHAKALRLLPRTRLLAISLAARSIVPRERIRPMAVTSGAGRLRRRRSA